MFRKSLFPLIAFVALASGAAEFADDLPGDWLLGSVPLTLLPQDQGDESPACLDGSPYGFYFKTSATNSTKWTINIQGGGWCNNEAGCYDRSKMSLGSSKVWPKTGGCSCMNVKEDGSMDQDCNCLWMPYGDGASFSGFRPKPWPVPASPGKSLYFRGIKNLDATLDWAFAHGLGEATEFVLTGGSAGGLSTFLHADRVAGRLAKAAPRCRHIRAAPVVGYFLDHDDFLHDGNNYTANMRYIYHMQNLTFGPDGGLMEECLAEYATTPHLCFMSPHMQSFIRTPYFMFNSKYDSWQLTNELKTKWHTQEQQDAVLQYGIDFMAQFEPVRHEPRNGAMVTSCVCHGCNWAALEVDGKTSYQHYADWYYGKTSGDSAIHVDARKPNGDGTLQLPSCTKFPELYPSASMDIVV